MGLRYSPLPSSDFLASFIYGDLTNEVKDSEDIVSSRGRTKDESTQTEGQYIYRQDLFNITTGFGYSDVNRNLDLNVDLGGFPFLDESNKQQITEASGYVYGNLNFPEPVAWTGGISYDNFRTQCSTSRKGQSKVRAMEYNQRSCLRGAAFRFVNQHWPTTRH